MRKTKEVIIQTDDASNRDAGKIYVITEFPARYAEKLAQRAFLALARSGVEISPETAAAGLRGLASVGIRMLSGVQFEEAEPILDDMLRCVKIAPDRSHPDMTIDLMPEHIEEVSTLIRLRKEVFWLHTGFSFPGEE